MHCKYLVFSVLVLCSFGVFAKERTYFGRVTDKGNHGLANVMIETVDGLEVMQCRANGVFSFKANTDTINAIDVLCPGYDTKEVSLEDIGNDSLFIVLTKSNNYLGGATVSAKGGKTEEEVVGVNRGGHSHGCYFSYKDELAVFLKVDSQKNAVIKEVGAYITKEGHPETKFLLHVYRKDSATGAPGDEITDTLLQMQARKGNEWIRADISDRLIQVNGGVFISVEWILGNDNDYFMYPIKDAKNYYAGDDSFKTVFNGQVLGLSWEDGGQPIVYKRYAHNIYDHHNEDVWFKNPPLRGGHKGREWITPMLYYKYSWKDK